MPIDPRIALGVQPLQVQYRDPIASYNQLAQLQSYDTQNQLAQMQMQESRQLAPLRLQEQQSRAASTKLTYDQAIEAQTFIKRVMDKAAEHPEAPTDPFKAAMQMLQHPSNSQVREAGAHLLDATQKLMAFKNQMANEKAYAEDQRTGGAAPMPAGAPAVVPSGSVNGTELPMVAPNVMQGGYPSQRDAAMLPQPANALAAQVAPAVAAAPVVNAMISGAASALQNADAIKKEIENGDDKYARGGIPAPGWKSKRELLVEAYKQALKPGRVGATSEFEQLLTNSGLSETEKQDMRKAKLAKETAKPADKVEAKSEFEKMLAESGLSEDQKQAARQAKITKETTLPVTQAERKSEFEKLLEDSGLSETEKQDMRKAKLAKETAKPADKVEAKSDFEKLLADSGLTEEQKQAARQAKITKETTAPTAQAERKTDFEKLLEDSGLSEDEKQAMRKAKLTKETSPSAAADSQFERTMTALGLSDDKKNAMRRQLLAKELRVPSEGGAGGERLPVGSMLVIDPADPTGKKVITVTTARAIKEGLIPASSVAKEEKLKPIPAHINTAISTNDMSIKQIQEALDLIKKNPNAIGLKNYLSDEAIDRADPKGVAARSALSNISSLVIHERSGSAVSASEMQRLGFIPAKTNTYDAAKTKLEAMLKYAKAQQQGLTETYAEDQGYKPNPIISGKSKVDAGEWKVVK
jgi:hypothetical protein